MPTSVDKTPGRRPNQWHSIQELAVTHWQDCFGTESSMLLSNTIGKCTDVGVCFRPPKIATVLVRICGRQNRLLGRKENIGLVWKVQRQQFVKDAPPLLKQLCLGCIWKDAEVDHNAVQSKADLFRRISTTKVTAAWRYDMERHTDTCFEGCCEFGRKTFQH